MCSKLIFIPKGTGCIIRDIGVATLDCVTYGTGHLNYLNSSAGNFSGRVVMISASFDQKENVAVMAWCFDARSLQWRQNGGDGVSNHQRLDYILKSLFRRRSKKTSKLRDTSLCERNPPVAGEFPSQRAKIVENVSIWWCHHVREFIFVSWMFETNWNHQIPCSFIPFIASSCVFVHLLGRFQPWKRGLLSMINASCCKSKNQPILSFLVRFDIGASCNCEIYIKTFYCGIIIEYHKNNDRAIEVTEM